MSHPTECSCHPRLTPIEKETLRVARQNPAREAQEYVTALVRIIDRIIPPAKENVQE